MSICKTPILKTSTSWFSLNGWICPENRESIYYTFPISITRISDLIKTLVALQGQLWTIPELPQTLIDKEHPLRFGTSTLTQNVTKIANYELVDGWEEILEILRRTDSTITKEDLTGFSYCTINPLTHLLVKNYKLEEINVACLSHKIFHINCSPEMEEKIDNIIERNFVPHEAHIYPQMFKISN